jgi:hypothetical protein
MYQTDSFQSEDVCAFSKGYADVVQKAVNVVFDCDAMQVRFQTPYVV